MTVQNESTDAAPGLDHVVYKRPGDTGFQLTGEHITLTVAEREARYPYRMEIGPHWTSSDGVYWERKTGACLGVGPVRVYETISSSEITAMALSVCTREELQAMPRQVRLSLLDSMERRRMHKRSPLTHAELEGIKELITVHLHSCALFS